MRGLPNYMKKITTNNYETLLSIHVL